MRIQGVDFKPRKTTNNLFCCIALFIFNWAGVALLMLFLGLMILDGVILAVRLIKVLP